MEEKTETYARLMNCRVFRAQTASKAIANWKTLQRPSVDQDGAELVRC